MQRVFLATRNSDLTEGKGRMITIAAFKTEEDAQKAVKGWGVLGAGDGEVQVLEVEETYEGWEAKQEEAARQSGLQKLTREEREALNL